MKKLFLMLAMMLPCLGAWAEVQKPQTSTAPENSAWNVDTQWFVITNGQGYVLSKDIADDNGNLKLTDMTVANATDDLLWCIVGDDINGYNFYNKAVGTDLVLGLKDTEGNARANFVAVGAENYTTEFDIAESKKTGATYWCLKEKGTANNCWNNRSGYLAYWNHANTLKGDAGSAFLFTPVDLSDMKEYTYHVTDNEENVYECVNTLIEDISWTQPQNITHPGLTIQSGEWKNEDIYAAKVTFSIPVSNSETTNKLMINGYNSTNQIFKWYVKENTYIKVNENSAPTTETINNYLWAIYPTLNEGKFTYTIKNIATEKFITSSLIAGHGDNTLGLADTGVAFELVSDRGYAFKVTDKTLYLSINTSKDDKGEQPVGLHSNLHDGTSVGFIPYVIKYTLTDAANNTFTGEYEGWAGHQTEPTFTGAKGYTLSNQVWDANANTLNATIDFKYPVSKVGETPNEILLDLYRSQNRTTAKYLRAVSGRVKVQTAEIAPVDVNALWAIYPSFEDGKFNFAIMNIATGKYIYSEAANNSSKLGDASDVILNATGSKFIIAGDGNDFRFADRENLFLSINSDRDADVLLGVHREAHPGTQMSAAVATSYGVKVGETTYATFYAPNAVTIPENVEAFAVTETNDGWATLTKIENTIPANTGVILKATGAGVYNFAITETVDEVENLLAGTVVATMVDGPAYVLGLVEGEVGLYNAKLTNGQFLNNGYKAYLPETAGASLQVLRFNFGGTTGIEDAIVAPSFDANAPIFDLSGRRVMNTVKGGIYIQNGKKFIVK